MKITDLLKRESVELSRTPESKGQAIDQMVELLSLIHIFFLTLEEESRAFISLQESRKDTFTIKKNTWGYLTIDVRTEGEFLSVEHTKVTTEEFIGNAYRLEYIIDYTKLHRGSNFGPVSYTHLQHLHLLKILFLILL